MTADRSVITSFAAARRKKGMTQAEVAAIAGWDQGRVAKIENTEDSRIKLGVLKKYAEALGMEVVVTLKRKRR